MPCLARAFRCTKKGCLQSVGCKGIKLKNTKIYQKVALKNESQPADYELYFNPKKNKVCKVLFIKLLGSKIPKFTKKKLSKK